MTNYLSRQMNLPVHARLARGCHGVRLLATASCNSVPCRASREWVSSIRQVLTIIALLCTVAAAAQGASAVGSTLVLRVDRDGKQEAAWVAAVAAHLAHNGETPVANPRITAKDLECKGPECLDAIAAREHARHVLTLSVQTNAPGSFVITGALYDSERHLPYQLPRPAVCDCSPAELVTQLGQVADELFKEYRKRPSASEMGSSGSRSPGGEPVKGSQVLGIGAGNPPGAATPNTGHSLSPKRKIIAGVLGGVAVGTLAAAVGLTAIDGTSTTPPCGSNRPVPQCIWDTRAPYGILYGATAALAIGVGITLFLPEGNEKAKVVTPVSSPAAARVEY